MTFLQYLQRIHAILGLGSRGNTAKPGTVPTTSASQTDELAEIVNWGIWAWTNFQTMHAWGWLIQRGTLAFTAGDPDVVPTATLTNYRDWVPFMAYGRKHVLRYVTADGATSTQTPVFFRGYADFRGLLDRQPVASGPPQFFTIRPDQTWEVYPTPDTGYTLVLDYLHAPKVFTAAGGSDSLNLEDHPATGRGLPDELQEAAVWHAVRYWAETRGKADLFQISARRFEELIAPIKARYLPHARI